MNLNDMRGAHAPLISLRLDTFDCLLSELSKNFEVNYL